MLNILKVRWLKMNNCGSIWLLSPEFDENSVKILYKFKKPEFTHINVMLPIFYDEIKNEFFFDVESIDGESLNYPNSCKKINEKKVVEKKEEIEVLINNKKIDEKRKKLFNGDIITYKGYKFRVELYDMEEKLNFNSFWHENLYLDNLPVFSSKAFEKLMEVEIKKAKRYNYPFSLILFRFESQVGCKDKEIEKIICENIRFTDMLSKISDYEYIIYLLQSKKEYIPKIIKKLKTLIYEILDIKVEFANGIEFNENFNSFNQMIIRLYHDLS